MLRTLPANQVARAMEPRCPPQDPAAILKTRFMAGVDNNTTASAKLANSAFFYPKKIAACFALGKSNWDASAATAAAPVTAGEESNPGRAYVPAVRLRNRSSARLRDGTAL